MRNLRKTTAVSFAALAGLLLSFFLPPSWATGSQSLTKGSFVLDPKSTVKFCPGKYKAQLMIKQGSLPPDYTLYLTEASVPNLLALDPQPKEATIPARALLIFFRNGHPALNQEYRLAIASAPGKEAATDWRRADLKLDIDSKSSLFANFITFARPGGERAAVKEALVTYQALPEKPGEELRMKFELHFDDGGVMRGSFAGPVAGTHPNVGVPFVGR